MCTCIYIYIYMQLQFKLDPLQSETGPSQTEAVQAQFFFLTPCLDGGCQIVKMCLMKPWGGLEDDESSSEESLSNFFCEDWVPKQKLPCLFCFKNNVNFPLVSHNRPTMPSQELSAEQQSFLEFGQDFSLMGGRLEIKIGQPCEHLVVVCVCVADSTCLQHRQFPLLIQALPNSGATSKGISPMHPTVTWINTSKNFQDTAVTDIPM